MQIYRFTACTAAYSGAGRPERAILHAPVHEVWFICCFFCFPSLSLSVFYLFFAIIRADADARPGQAQQWIYHDNVC